MITQERDQEKNENYPIDFLAFTPGYALQNPDGNHSVDVEHNDIDDPCKKPSVKRSSRKFKLNVEVCHDADRRHALRILW